MGRDVVTDVPFVVSVHTQETHRPVVPLNTRERRTSWLVPLRKSDTSERDQNSKSHRYRVTRTDPPPIHMDARSNRSYVSRSYCSLGPLGHLSTYSPSQTRRLRSNVEFSVSTIKTVRLHNTSSHSNDSSRYYLPSRRWFDRSLQVFWTLNFSSHFHTQYSVVRIMFIPI